MPDAKILTLLAFIIINFTILFSVKTRTTTVTSLIIAHLVIILFLSVSISSYAVFKEITLAVIIYSMVALFLISNYDIQEFENRAKLEFKRSFSFISLSIFGFVFLTTIFAAIFFITKNVANISDEIREDRAKSQNEILQNPMILPSHPVHIAIKEFYLGKKFEDQWSDKILAAKEISQRKRVRLKDKLSDSFLFKRSSDVILIIVAASVGLLIVSGFKKEEENVS